MIHFTDENALPSLRRFLKQQNIFACRISCLLQSYGILYDFLSFYIQTDENGAPVGAAAKYYADLTLCLTSQSDLDEWREFVTMSGAHSVLCEPTLFADKSCQTGTVMTLKKSRDQRSITLPQGYTLSCQPDLKALYQLLKGSEAEDFRVPAYEDFLLDLSHKLRHNTAACAVLLYRDTIAAAALTVAQDERSAIIGCVTTARPHRRKGLGSFCVSALINMLHDRTIFIMRDKDRHETFYLQLGFENTSSFTLYET